MILILILLSLVSSSLACCGTILINKTSVFFPDVCKEQCLYTVHIEGPYDAQDKKIEKAITLINSVNKIKGFIFIKNVHDKRITFDEVMFVVPTFKQSNLNV